MNLLYQVKRSPFMSHDLDQVLIVAKDGSHIMLYQDRVMAAAVQALIVAKDGSPRPGGP